MRNESFGVYYLLMFLAAAGSYTIYRFVMDSDFLPTIIHLIAR